MGLEVCVFFAESIGLLVQASVSLVVEIFVCELEGFIVDFVTTRSIPQHEEQTHKRVLPPKNMTKHCKWKSSLKLRTAARCCSKLSERTRANRMGYDESCSRKLSARNPLIANVLLQRIFLATVAAKSDSQRFQGRCCQNDIDQRLSQNEIPLSRGHVVRILSVVLTVELDAR